MRYLLFLLVLLWNLSAASVGLSRVLGKTVFDQQHILSYMQDYDCHLLSLSTGQSLHFPAIRHQFDLATLDWYKLSPDQQMLLTRTASHYLVQDREGVVTYEQETPANFRVGSVNWLADSRHLAYVYLGGDAGSIAVSYSAVIVTDVMSGESIELGHYDNIVSATPAPQGDWLFLHHNTNGIYLREAQAQSYVVNWRTGEAYAVGEIPRSGRNAWEWSPNGEWLAAIATSQRRQPPMLTLLNILTGQRMTIPVEAQYLLGWSPDSHYILASDGRQLHSVVWLVDVSTPEKALSIALEREPIYLRWSPDSREVFFMHHYRVNDQAWVSLLSLENPAVERQINFPPNTYIPFVDWLGDSQHLLSAWEYGKDQTEINLWGLDGHSLQTWLINRDVYSVRLLDPGQIDFQEVCSA